MESKAVINHLLYKQLKCESELQPYPKAEPRVCLKAPSDSILNLSFCSHSDQSFIENRKVVSDEMNTQVQIQPTFEEIQSIISNFKDVYEQSLDQTVRNDH